ncbi:enoyl-CoA hydratase/isomerase family protein [Corynebacterium halotolerans]|uniref:enoyl-CoA hydratase/isomerase family protein n=1 Tax=Corynebacterium halotolerans TaxID=225326 RepID=UPI003CED4D8B
MTENSANTTPSTADPEVRAYVRGSTGVLELNRPKALNSLTPEMVAEIAAALQQWREDDDVSQVLVYSNSERGFCAGGDVRFARDKILAGEQEEVDQFFRDEYDMNHQLATFPKPYVALIDGVVMGGGLGISLHGSHRVVTERAFAAMPEMAIGYFTDVGVAYESQRMVGRKGQSSQAVALLIGLTGWRLSPADMVWCGLATHVISSKSLQDFMDAMIDRGIDAALAEHQVTDPKDSELAEYAIEIEECFGHRTWADIDAALEDSPNSEFSELIRKLMAGANPTSVVATTELFTACLPLQDLRAALDKEVALGETLRREPNFLEGVRAVLVDKDRDASFEPAEYADVDVAKYREVVGG